MILMHNPKSVIRLAECVSCFRSLDVARYAFG